MARNRLIFRILNPKKRKMNWKLVLGILVIVALLGIASIIVYNNRANEKLVSNFSSLLFLGTLGLFITAFVSLKSEVSKTKFGAVLFLEKEPLSLPVYKYQINLEGKSIHISTNEALKRIESDSLLKSKLSEFINTPNSNWYEELFLRYVFDLLISRYESHWYYESLQLKLPSAFTSQDTPVDNSKEKTIIKWSEIQEVFSDNFFIQQPHSYLSNGDEIKVTLTVPKDIKMSRNIISNGQEIIFENRFTELKISISRMLSVGDSVNEEISKAFNISQEKKENFKFYPFKIKTSFTKKKFRSGHPNMSEYDYWANDLINHLQGNISIDEFWRIIALNQKRPIPIN